MKKTFRRILSALLVAVMLVGVAPVGIVGKETAHAVEYDCLEDMPMVSESHYTGNMGDSRVFNLNRKGLPGNDNKYYRNGNIGLDGTTYNNGFEVWVARWNFGDKISWASATFDIGNKYKTLSGKSGIVKGSANTDSYDTSVYFYNGESLLYSFRITPDDYEKSFVIDVSGVSNLTLMVKDNKETARGTSIALYDLFFDKMYQQNSVGDIIEFGSYPQSKVTDSATVSKLDGVTKKWESYGYYSGTGYVDGNMKPSDYMQYADFTYGGNKYRAVTFSEYRPYYTSSISSLENSWQDNNGYYINDVYYFKYEPLKWRVLDASTGFIVCNSVIDSQPYSNCAVYSKYEYYGDVEQDNYASNWEYCSLQKWLNEDFYKTAFSIFQQERIQQLTRDNKSTYTSEYDSNPTSDKITLLSYWDALNTDYGFSSLYQEKDSARKLKISDYAQCQGCFTSSGWLLRSPRMSYSVSNVGYDGWVRSETKVYDISGIVPALNLDNLSNLKSTEIKCSDDKKVIPIGYDFNVSATYKSSTLNPTLQTISCRVEGESGGVIANGSMSIIGVKDNATLSASFKAEKLGEYKITFASTDGAEDSMTISVVSDTYDKYLASSLIKLRKDKIQKTKMLYGFIYDEGLTVNDNLEAFIRVKEYRKEIKYFYELIIMDILLDSVKDNDFKDVLNGNVESIEKKLVNYGLKYNKFSSQTAFENAKISDLSYSEIESINKAYKDAKVMCNSFSDMSAVMDGINTVKDYTEALSKYAALQNVKEGYIEALRAVYVSELSRHDSGDAVDLNVAEFAAALEDIIAKYENYQLSITDCFKSSASDLIWDLTKEVAEKILEYAIGAEAVAIINIAADTANLVWQVFEPKELFVAESTLKCTLYFENRLKSVLDNAAAQFNASNELEHAVLFNNCYEMLLACFTYGNSIHSYVEDFTYNGTPAAALGSLISSSQKVTHKDVCKYIEKSNGIVKNEYNVIKNITEKYRSYVYNSNMIWEISLDYNAELKRTETPVLYDYSDVSITYTQNYYDGEPIDISSTNPTRNGYDFSGWYYDKNCTKAFKNGTKASEDLTLYAKWTPTAFYNIKDNKASISEIQYIAPPISRSAVSPNILKADSHTYYVPAYIDGYEVAGIEDNAVIKNNGSVNKLYIPNTITYVGKNSFKNCDNLVTVIIPDSVKTISDGAFSGCNKITKVIFNGTEEQWDEINIGNNNEPLTKSDVIFSPSQGSADLTVKEVSLSDITLNYKKSTTLKPTITADEGAKYTVKYSSSNPSVARVDENGKVYAAKKGSATITCTVTDSNGNTVTDTCNVKVKYSFGQWLIVIVLFGWIWY